MPPGTCTYQGVPAGIAGIGHKVPDWVIDNDWFVGHLDTSDEWIQQRTGIVQRRWLRDGEKPSDLFVEAADMALRNANVARDQVDLIVVGSVSGDYTAPSAACVVQQRMGLPKCGAFDVAAACSGFLYALATGTSFIATGRYKNVLVIGGEAMSRMINKQDRNTAVLFGDGAGAVLMQPWETCRQGLVEDFTLGADGEGIPYIVRPRGGGADPMTEEIVRKGEHYITMQGRAVYRFAAQRMIWLLDWAMRGKDPARLGWMIPHQMNRRILEEATRHLGIPPEKVLHNIHKYGNTSSASVPILMSEGFQKGLFEKDKYLVLGAFGAGLTWAGARILW